MKLTAALLMLLAAAEAACPNQCSGHGRCGEDDKCICFRQQGLYSPFRYGFNGPDCSLRTCPLGKAYDAISSSTPGLTPIVFRPSEDSTTSKAKLVATFIPVAQNRAFKDLRRDTKFYVKIMSVIPASPTSLASATFAWRRDDQEYYFNENPITDYTSAARAIALNRDNLESGVFIYWDPIKGNTPSFNDDPSQIAAGDIYEFTLTYNEGDSFDGSDSNTAHQLVECSGRGLCDSVNGKCDCLPGYSGEACQRTVCPNQCSGHGSCQTELRFATEGDPANGLANGYTAYDGDQQYGCKCDRGYRGPDCSQIECPSGPDVLKADGGAEGLDCSGRGLCDYNSGVCKCFKGFFGERCETQTTLI